MTKDVLVSISGKHIDIMDDPARGYEVGEDGIEVVTPANYYCRNGKHYILYDEVLEGMAGTIKNKIKITGTDCLEIMKSGVTSSHMVFEKNKKNLTYYKTPYGQMLVGVNTKNMEISVDEDQIGVKVAYELDVNRTAAYAFDLCYVESAYNRFDFFFHRKNFKHFVLAHKSHDLCADLCFYDRNFCTAKILRRIVYDHLRKSRFF